MEIRVKLEPKEQLTQVVQAGLGACLPIMVQTEVVLVGRLTMKRLVMFTLLDPAVAVVDLVVITYLVRENHFFHTTQ